MLVICGMQYPTALKKSLNYSFMVYLKYWTLHLRIFSTLKYYFLRTLGSGEGGKASPREAWNCALLRSDERILERGQKSLVALDLLGQLV